MKSVIALTLLVALATAAPSEQDAAAMVLKYESDNIGVDGYKFNYETSNGIMQQETGELVDKGTEQASIAVRGSFSYTDPATNQQYTVNYVADKNGFQPEGAHIPVAAPVAPAAAPA